MPFDNGRLTTTRKELEDRRRRVLSMRLMNQKKERQVPELALRNTVQRPACYYVVVHPSSLLQVPEWINQALPNVDGSKSLSSPLAVGSQADLPGNTDGSDFLIKDTLDVKKRGKKSSRKKGKVKGKKKGKQHKRTRPRKVLIKSDAQCDDSTISVSASLTDEKFMSHADKAILEDNHLSKTMPTALLDRDCTVNEDDTEKNNEYVHCSATSTSCRSYIDEMDDSELSGSNERFAGEEFKHTITTNHSNPRVGKFPKTLLSAFVGNIEDLEVNSKFDDGPSSSYVANSGASSLADFSHDGWNTDDSTNGSEDMEIMLTVKEESQLYNFSDGRAISCGKKIDVSSCTSSTDSFNVITDISEESCVSNPFWSTDVLDVCSILERAECSSQASSSDGFCPVVYRNKGRRARKITDNESYSRTNRPSVEAVDNRVGRNAKTSMFRSNDSIIISSHDDKPSKDSKMIVKQENSVNLQENVRSSYQYWYSDESRTYNTINSSQPRAKHTLGSFFTNVKYKAKKQTSRSKSYDGMGRKNSIFDMHLMRNDLQTSPVNHSDKTSSCLGIHGSTSSTQLSAEADNCCKLIREQEIHIPVSLENNCTLSDDDTSHSYSDLDPLPTGRDSSSQMLESDGSVFSVDMFGGSLVQASETNTSLTLEITASIPREGNLQNNCGPVPKLDHVERNLVVQDDKSSEGSRPSEIGETCSGILDTNNGTVPRLDSNELSIYPSSDNGIIYSSLKDTENSSAESLQLTNKLRSFPRSIELVCCQEPVHFEADLDKITQAVVCAYKLQVASEVVQNVVGNPVADFEKFLNSASPVIDQIHSSISSAACCQERVIDRTLCSHRMPNFPLKNLWQWYEEPGCFGLEVKALKNNNLKKSSNHATEFNAYFVPSLSAVQLFGNSRSIRCCKRFEQTVKTSEAQMTPNSMESLPILSSLIPQPRKEVGNCLSGLCFSGEDELSDHPGKRNVHGKDLLFEYFESDQPSWRQPLFEKIKELVSGHTLTNSQFFGNSETLESVSLRDLHPASWYSVAWYPIYSIPEGNVRAAFLTYHSLGHIVHRSLPCGTGSLQNVVCPVVGLQTYNDKGESWFQPRVPDSQVFESEDALYTKPSELIRERLRTLKETASIMATTVVSKGNESSVNKHPDFDFFLSRRR